MIKKFALLKRHTYNYKMEELEANEERNKAERAREFLTKYGRIEVPEYQQYLRLDKAFGEFKKETRDGYKKRYNLIISNEQARDLIFYGVECKLSPKEFFIVTHLLENKVFDNINLKEKRFVSKKRKYNKYKSGYNTTKEELELFSATYNQMKDYKNKIKKKIQRQMEKQKIEKNDFEKKFESFMRHVNRNYETHHDEKIYVLATRFRKFAVRSKTKNQAIAL